MRNNAAYIDANVMNVNNANVKRNGRYFYNNRNVNSDGKVVRVFDESLLRLKDNPFTRRPWGNEDLRKAQNYPVKDTLSEMTQNGGGYHKYNRRTYKIRSGSRGGRYILVKDKKIYV